MKRSPTPKIAALAIISLSFVSCSNDQPVSLEQRFDQVSAQNADGSSRSSADQRKTSGTSQFGNVAEMCDGTNQVWGLTNNSKTSWYAVKKKVLPVEGTVGSDGYIVTDIDANYSNIQFQLAFNIDKLNSQNPLRDTRIRKFFFSDIATATFKLEQITKEKTGNDLPIVGDTDKVEFKGTLEMAGASIAVTIPAYITRTIDALHIVNSDKPTVMDVTTNSTLVKGVQSLLEVASLSDGDMEKDVSVKFDYTFKQSCTN